jgi:hypothetical protein
MPSKLETMKSKVLLQSAIAKTVGAGRNKGDVSTSFRERESRLTDTYEKAQRLLTRDIAKQNFLFLLMERMALL